MTEAKVCGLMTAEDVAIVNQSQPEYAGFVLAAGRHHVDRPRLQALASQLLPTIKRVAVVVTPDVPQLIALHQAGVIDGVQIHRVSPIKTITALQQAGIPVIARVSGDQPATIAEIALLDAGDGSGQALDWRRLPAVNQPLMLAGGLAADNVQQAIAQVHPQIVDASSRLETAGHKDAAKVEAFVRAAHFE